MGVDIGASEAPVEPALRRTAAAAPAPEPVAEAEAQPEVTEAEMSGEAETVTDSAEG
jgi:hypothetical protein